jgi:hypothetical protein
MQNQTDPEVVRQGAPAYLLLMDSLLAGSPDDVRLLQSAAALYGAYSGAFVADPERRRALSDRALEYAMDGACARSTDWCSVKSMSFDAFENLVAAASADDLPMLYSLGTAWAGWIDARSSDWRAIADLPLAEALLQKVVDVEPGYERGRAQLYLGVIRSQLPASLGGRPEQGRKHFENAIRYSDGRDLLAKVEFARRYARLVYDQPLHDRLLNEVLDANVREPGFTVSNVLAREHARELIDDGFF